MIEISYNYVATHPILSRTHAYPGRPSCDRRVENAVGGSRPDIDQWGSVRALRKVGGEIGEVYDER